MFLWVVNILTAVQEKSLTSFYPVQSSASTLWLSLYSQPQLLHSDPASTSSLCFHTKPHSPPPGQLSGYAFVLFAFNPNYPGCCAKMHTLFGIIFWNNCAWLNMFCALLNAARFEGQWIWLSFYISFYKDGTPPGPPCVHQCLYAHTGAGLIRVWALGDVLW